MHHLVVGQRVTVQIDELRRLVLRLALLRGGTRHFLFLFGILTLFYEVKGDLIEGEFLGSIFGLA